MTSFNFFNDESPAWPRPKTSDGTTKPRRPGPSRNVSFKSEDPTPHLYETFLPPPPKIEETWQPIDRHAQNVDPNIEPALPQVTKAKQKPFAIYDESFSTLLGPRPSVDLLISDTRAPFFYSGGTWIPRLSTIFLTSNLIRDSDPLAVSSANRRTEITKLEIVENDNLVRDKVRCPDRRYMVAGCAMHPQSDSPSIIFCAQGSLKEPAGLVSIDAKRPHKARMLLNNFHGRPLNSPCDIVTNHTDNSLYFTDPAYGYERGFRPKPQLPPGHIYRFEPQSGDCRVIVSGLSRPASLAFSPDYNVLYVSELGDKYGGTYIYAYDITYAHTLRPTPSFNISVVPGGMNGLNGSHRSGPSSSTDSSAESFRTRSAKHTPDSSPPGIAAALNLVDRKSLSRSNSHSAPRRPEMSAHRLLSSLSMDTRSQTRGPTSNPVDMPPPTATSFPSSITRSTFLANRRLFAYSPNNAPSGGISTDPVQGNVWLGTEEGVEVWSAITGELVGKILVDDWEERPSADDKTKKMNGVSKVAFTGYGRALLLGGQRIWQLSYG